MATHDNGKIFITIDGCSTRVIRESLIESVFIDEDFIEFSMVSCKKISITVSNSGEKEFADVLRVLSLLGWGNL
jgi:hypothetical protein